MRMILSLAMVIALGAGGAAAAEIPTIHMNAFLSASDLPVWVGQHEGFYRKHGIELDLSYPAGSVEQIKGVMDGKYQIISTALDNVVAYREGQGGVDLGGPVDLFAFMGIDSGFLTLVTAPGIRRIADLKGKVMAVDAMSTGFSFALKEILARNGIPGDAVTYIAVGSSGARWKALEEGKAQAALLTMPLDLEATDKGFSALTTVAKTLGHYNATVMAARQSWAKTHDTEIVAFVRGTRDAVQWLVAPAHRAAAIAILHEKIPSLDASKLDRIYALLTDPKQGIYRNLAIDRRGAQTVLDLRARYAVPAHKLPNYLTYADLRYLKEAQKP
jgi:ABC-type nitrate/sulfonate/bicarbonate transport system substrate-binding protein